ncbi:GNAT family N-acetyltransferase [Mucilaginibacter ginkgonis]|uniref:GNAT family N-acetyltransferase n=1 Tax=Mucilaginibacter ginkgonis TaxID=2682091 RepID=A0A6I4ING3_9SPHI|nr:GNAT family N-acetyltransferase [Mucilaginibacter ginkgonis]QQL49795.1 GNAT family N-acetyltransferase [Mucilaginibacter ginkgonis]
MTTTLKRTNSTNADFLSLVAKLDAELVDMYGEQMDFYGQYNKVDKLNNCIVIYDDNVPVACGAFKEYEPGVAEVKRMYVEPGARGKGFSKQVLGALEVWATELGYHQIILETGDQQIPAMALYNSMGYLETENYGQYIGAPSSVCYAKSL